VGGLEAVLKMAIYFMHERGWDRIKWGRREVQPFVVWLTGLSGSGKTSIAREVAEKLRKTGLKVDHVDGETIRDLFPKTGFTRDEVNEHIERVGLLASRLENRGVCVVASFLSPYRESRDFVRDLCQNFIEVHVATPLEVCEERDYKNLFSRARRGEIRHLPGVDVEYEAPENPELVVDTHPQTIEDASKKIMNHVKRYM